jgi:hypothetical protein
MRRATPVAQQDSALRHKPYVCSCCAAACGASRPHGRLLSVGMNVCMYVAEQAALWKAFATVAAAFTRFMPVLSHCAGLLPAGSLMVFLLLCWALAVVPMAWTLAVCAGFVGTPGTLPAISLPWVALDCDQPWCALLPGVVCGSGDVAATVVHMIFRCMCLRADMAVCKAVQ